MSEQELKAGRQAVKTEMLMDQHRREVEELGKVARDLHEMPSQPREKLTDRLRSMMGRQLDGSLVKWAHLKQLMGHLLDGLDGIYEMILNQQMTLERHEDVTSSVVSAVQTSMDQTTATLNHHLQQLYQNDMALRDALGGADENMAIYQRAFNDMWVGMPYLGWLNGVEGETFENGQRPIDWARYRGEYVAALGLAAFCAGHRAWLEQPTKEPPVEPVGYSESSSAPKEFDPEEGAVIFGD